VGNPDGALDALQAAAPSGWYVGRPSFHDERYEWQMYAFDSSEVASGGIRKREWTAIASSEEAVVREMARYLRRSARAEYPSRGRDRMNRL
jgi:hypothetical protein